MPRGNHLAARSPPQPPLTSVMLFSRRLSAARTANSHISHSGVASWEGEKRAKLHSPHPPFLAEGPGPYRIGEQRAQELGHFLREWRVQGSWVCCGAELQHAAELPRVLRRHSSHSAHGPVLALLGCQWASCLPQPAGGGKVEGGEKNTRTIIRK